MSYIINIRAREPTPIEEPINKGFEEQNYGGFEDQTNKEIEYGEVVDRDKLMSVLGPKSTKTKGERLDSKTGKIPQVITSSKKPNVKDEKAVEKKKLLCRICYGEEEEKNPLIYPCNCSGSMKYIHFECLRNWLSTKISTQNAGYEDECSISYGVKEIKCELCKANFPLKVKIKDSDNIIVNNIFVHNHEDLLSENINAFEKDLPIAIEA